MRRFELKLPCLVYVRDEGDRCSFFNTTTVDIGAGGALLRSTNPFPIGTGLSLELVIYRTDFWRTDFWKNFEKASCISLFAEVCRNEARGMAVVFSNGYQIMRMQHFVRLSWARTQWLEGFNTPCKHAAGPSRTAAAETIHS